jgi:K+-transporting ATPase ATPase A chain
MSGNSIWQYALYLAVLIGLAVPLGKYVSKAMNGEKVILSRVLRPCENGIYRLLRIDKNENMGWKKYAACALVFSGISLVFLMAVLMLQQFLPANPQHLDGMSWHLAFNTAVSFVTNTNWQAYSGESALGYFAQAIGLTVQNFLSAAVGIAVLFALIRGFTRVKEKGIGSFWTDVTRAVLYVMLPLSLLVSVALISQGVVQNLKPYETVDLIEPIETEDGETVTKQMVPMGPQASQVAPKQLGTNGGGYNGANSASPLENPTPLSNLIELLSILLIPASLCFSFGREVKDKRQGRVIFAAMFVMLVVSLAVIAVNEQAATPQLSQEGQVDLSQNGQAGGNMEGKETRFGIASSSAWAAFTTAASNGSVNSMHDSYTPLGGLATLLLMELGEVVFGGVGCGLYGMLGFVLLTVFIAGLMVGRTPEYLGKKIEPFEMRMAVLICLATPIAILVGSGVAAAVPQVTESLNNSGAHGFSELLYAYSSCGGNNGSAFAGFNANTPFLNVTLGLVMLFARFVPMLAAVAAAGSLVQKKKTAVSAGTLSTCNVMFAVLLILIVLLIGALSFLPALSLGPVAEHLAMFS